ncbi:hypothetical protein AMELA_G00219240 [Ameiurus melas]|uniref:Annexin n=1 Tax=Ameiurus melas TaxID=219545 RepID=A0A7J6A1P2_AMEME|nr:hypothetical protein AMELA_G00219240 [Ameiurus melas]
MTPFCLCLSLNDCLFFTTLTVAKPYTPQPIAEDERKIVDITPLSANRRGRLGVESNSRSGEGSHTHTRIKLYRHTAVSALAPGSEMENEPITVEYIPAKKSMWWGTLGTVRPFLPFDPYLDAHQIYTALVKKNADVMTVMKILTNRTNAQRQGIASAYQNHTQKDLSATLKKSLSGAVQELLLALMMTPSRFDAHRLRQSMEVSFHVIM